MSSDKCLPAREKTWDERDLEGRLELLRREVRFMRNLCLNMEETVMKLVVHQHSPSGEVTVGIREPNTELRFRHDPLK